MVVRWLPPLLLGLSAMGLFPAEAARSRPAGSAAGAQIARGAQGGAAGGPTGEFSFAIEPRQGPSTGGTLVTFAISGSMPPGKDASGDANFFCQFGERAVPVQSFFLAPRSDPGEGQPAVVCAAPAGPMRTSVTTRLSLDGRRFTSGPRFYYHDASSAPAAGSGSAN